MSGLTAQQHFERGQEWLEQAEKHPAADAAGLAAAHFAAATAILTKHMAEMGDARADGRWSWRGATV